MLQLRPHPLGLAILCALFVSCGSDTTSPGELDNDPKDMACENVNTDPKNCGSCGTSCAPGQVCNSGACSQECSKDAPLNCFGSCVDPNSDETHCGSCDEACATGELCVAGQCAESCAALGQTECDSSCVDTRFNAQHCGSCGRACESGEVCSGGECRSSCPFERATTCNENCTDVDSDPANCGACGVTCDASEVCADGLCRSTCSESQPDQCGRSCVNLRSSDSNCGTCSNTCAADKVCTGGSCENECGGSRPTQCDGLCVNLFEDASHCGACGQSCPSGEVCSGGRCLGACDDPRSIACGGACVDTDVSSEHCGGCGLSCKSGALCANGVCANECLGSKKERCGDTCVDLDSSLAHCGSCNNSCEVGEVCVGGTCGSDCPSARPIRCGSTCVSAESADSCLPACAGTAPDRCGAGCFDLKRDIHHCGDCETACSAGQICQAGSCSPVCAAPDALCAGSCVNVLSDEKNCGGCGIVCDDSLDCVQGSCRPTLVDVAASTSAACSLYSDSSVYCWGRYDNQFGVDMPVNYGPYNVRRPNAAWVPTQLQDLTSVSLSQYSGCVVNSKGSVECWGSYPWILGQESTDPPSYLPPRVLTGWPKIKGRVALTRYSACAVTTNGELVCWGGSPRGAPVPDEDWTWSIVPGLENIATVVAGVNHVCARETDGTMWCFGPNYTGAVSPGLPEEHVSPVRLVDLPPLLLDVDLSHSMALGPSHTCAIVGSGEVYCWGYNGSQELGVEGEPESFVEVTSLPAPAISLGAFANATCATLSDSSAFCWGRFLGYNQVDFSPAVLLESGVKHVLPADELNVILMTDGSLQSFGECEGCLARSPQTPQEPRSCCGYPN